MFMANRTSALRKEGRIAMKLWSALLASFAMVTGAASLAAQAPVLSSIEAPYSPVQAQVQMAGKTYPSGTVAYGAAGTPLVLSGSGLGDNGVVWFIPYKNGVLDTNTPPAQGVVTLWTAGQIFVKVPSGAVTGLVEVLTADNITNGLPFVVTQGTYSNSCPAGPSGGQLQITTDSLQNGTVSHTYSAQLAATGGSHSYTWTVITGSLPSGLSLSGSGLISGTPTAATNPINFTVQAIDTSTPPLYDEATLSLAVSAQPEAGSGATLYNFSIQTSGGSAEGYDSAGNVTGYTDSVNGTWSFAYDSLNRLATASGAQDNNLYPNYCWSYDSFGNRLAQTSSATAYSSSNGGANSCPIGSGPSWGASYNSNNQISGGLYAYDAAGNISADSTTGNSYLYDAEGRLCAMQQTIDGTTEMIGYIYNAEGVRVAKGTLSSFSCNTSNGFTATTVYVLGPSGDQMTEMTNNAGSWQWKHTNVFAPGLSATYDTDLTGQTEGQVYFHLSDWLGTRRQQTDYAGNPLLNFTELPYGDGLNTIPVSTTDAGDATEHHFTGKERDTESGNDYFEARYYSSATGRFISPDWSAKEEPVPYAVLDDPQSLNLYTYVRNNPLARTDPDGHCCDGIAFPSEGPGAPPLPNPLHPLVPYPDKYTLTPGKLEQAFNEGGAAIWSFESGVYNKVRGWFSKSASTEQGRDAQGKFLPKEAGQTKPGADAEKAGLDAVGAVKNTKPLPGSSRIPDGTGTGTVEGGAKAGQPVEVKSGSEISRTGQLAEAGQASVNATGHPLQVVLTHPNPNVSAPAKRDPNLQIVHRPQQ